MSSIETVNNYGGFGHVFWEPGTHNVSSFTTSGSGTGAVFAIEVDGHANIENISVTTKGSGYSRNDTITVVGSQIGSGGESLTLYIPRQILQHSYLKTCRDGLCLASCRLHLSFFQHQQYMLL